MTRYVQTEVAELRDNPTDGENVRLLIGYSGQYSDVAEQVTKLDGKVVEKLPFDSALINLPENKIGALENKSTIETVEFDEDMELLAGN